MSAVEPLRLDALQRARAEEARIQASNRELAEQALSEMSGVVPPGLDALQRARAEEARIQASNRELAEQVLSEMFMLINRERERLDQDLQILAAARERAAEEFQILAEQSQLLIEERKQLANDRPKRGPGRPAFVRDETTAKRVAAARARGLSLAEAAKVVGLSRGALTALYRAECDVLTAGECVRRSRERSKKQIDTNLRISARAIFFQRVGAGISMPPPMLDAEVARLRVRREIRRQDA